MKLSFNTTTKSCLGGLFTAVLGLLSISAAHGQIFVSDPVNDSVGEYNLDGTTVNASFIPNQISAVAISESNLFTTTFGNGTTTGTIGEYNATTGDPLNVPLIGGLADPTSLAISGTTIFVSNYNSGKIGEYTTSGETVNSSLISNLVHPTMVVVAGTDLFIAEQSGVIAEYTTSGAAVNTSLISGLSGPSGIVVSGSNLFVVNSDNNTIGEYTTSGAPVDAMLVTGLHIPQGLALLGNDLFVVNQGNGTVGEYTTSGEIVNDSLVSNLLHPFSIVVVPEPSTWALLLGGLGLLVYWRIRTRQTII
jgi:hypothetical protein